MATQNVKEARKFYNSPSPQTITTGTTSAISSSTFGTGEVLLTTTTDCFFEMNGTVSIVNEAFTSSADTGVSLAYINLDTTVAPVVTSTDGATTFTVTTDYTIDSAAGEITVLSTGTMVDATGYHIDYTYYSAIASSADHYMPEDSSWPVSVNPENKIAVISPGGVGKFYISAIG